LKDRRTGLAIAGESFSSAANLLTSQGKQADFLLLEDQTLASDIQGSPAARPRPMAQVARFERISIGPHIFRF
jgi:hypothetical protein